MLRFEGKHIVKVARPAGKGSAGIYVPKDWADSEVLAIRLELENQTSRE